MLHRILMHIIQARQVSTLLLKFPVPKIEPNLTARSLIEFVNPASRFHVQYSHYFFQARCIVRIFRRVSDKMVMI